MQIQAKKRILSSEYYEDSPRSNARDLFKIFKQALGVSKTIPVAPYDFNGFPGFVSFSETNYKTLAKKVVSALKAKGITPNEVKGKHNTVIFVNYETYDGESYSVSCLLQSASLDEYDHELVDNTFIHVQKGMV